MDDQVQKPTIQQDESISGNQQVPVPPQKQPVEPVAYAPNKESASVLVSDKEPNIHPEAAAVGVEAVPDKPKLDEVHEKIGVRLPGDSTPVSITPSGKVTLPIDNLSEEEATKIIKEGEGSNMNVSAHTEGIYSAPSILGLAVLKLKEIKRKIFGHKA